MASVQLGVSFIKAGASGLISGQIVAQIISNYRLGINAKNNYNTQAINKSEIKRLAKRYKDFPKFSMWAILANTLAYNLTNILISIYYSIATLGLYSLAQRILGIPASLIGSAISQVFFQEASDEKLRTGVVLKSFDKTLKKLIILSFPTFSLIMIIAEDLFAIVFGENWRVAGTYTMYLTPMIAVRFIVAGVSPVDTVMEKQKYFLFFNIVLAALSLVIVIFFGSGDFEKFIIIYSIVVMFIYLIYGFMLRLMADNKI
jgi:O-antigen/teichoic acid export membrane protein